MLASITLGACVASCGDSSKTESGATDSVACEVMEVPVEEDYTGNGYDRTSSGAYSDYLDAGGEPIYGEGNGEGRTSSGAYSDYLEAGGEPIHEEYNPNDYYGN